MPSDVRRPEKHAQYGAHYLSYIRRWMVVAEAHMDQLEVKNKRLQGLLRQAWTVVGDSEDWQCDCVVCETLRAVLTEEQTP